MDKSRGEFTSRTGFIMAAAGSAVGLGNIWGFPTQAASNGGGAFLLVYLLLAFFLAYPVLMAELIIGRHAHANAVTSLQAISSNMKLKKLGKLTGTIGFITAGLILSFYAIVGGWMAAHALASGLDVFLQLDNLSFLTEFGALRNAIFMIFFMLLTIAIVSAGVSEGIERWSTRLMPILIITMFLLSGYVLTLDGALNGLRVYLIPDVSALASPSLIIDALGSAFFSLSLGVGTMLIYGSYLKDDENLPITGSLVTLVDVSIAVLAGFLILPAMYVALNNGVDIFAPDGSLISEDTLIFSVLPSLFESMDFSGKIISFTFFSLMLVAALTSAISMLEVPVAYAIEEMKITRKQAVLLSGSLIAAVSLLIVMNFHHLFGLVVTLTTRFAQPLLGMVMCVYVAWVWQRASVLQEIRKGNLQVENSIFWKVWPVHVKFFCPIIILMIFLQGGLR